MKQNPSLPVSIRLEDELSKIRESAPPSAKEIAQEITCKENPLRMRIVQAGSLRMYASLGSNLWKPSELLEETPLLLSVVKDRSENITLRNKVFDELSKAYYYKKVPSSSAKELFDTSEELLQENEDSALVAINALVGPLADIDLNKSKELVWTYISRHQDNFKERKISLSAALAPFMGEKNPEAMAVVRKICASEPNFSLCRFLETQERMIQ